MNFHPRLVEDCIIVGRFSLSYLLLHKDANYPWFILVPDRQDITEIYQLCEDDQRQLMLESCILAETLSRDFNADKINIAALGNLVPQLHVHHIARYQHDIAWPAPIWGLHPPIDYTSGKLAECLQIVKKSGMAGFQFTNV